MVVYNFCTQLGKYREYLRKFHSELPDDSFSLGTSPLASKWEPLEVIWEPNQVEWGEKDRNRYMYGDISECGSPVGSKILSRRALDVLQPHLKDQVEFLPLICDDPNVDVFMRELIFFEWNDVLDEEQSILNWETLVTQWNKHELTQTQLNTIPSQPYNTFVFQEEKIKDRLIFKIKQFPTHYTFVTKEFVDIIREHNLTGAKFQRIYPLTRKP